MIKNENTTDSIILVASHPDRDPIMSSLFAEWLYIVRNTQPLSSSAHTRAIA
jgi:hypothetical protein